MKMIRESGRMWVKRKRQTSVQRIRIMIQACPITRTIGGKRAKIATWEKDLIAPPEEGETEGHLDSRELLVVVKTQKTEQIVTIAALIEEKVAEEAGRVDLDEGAAEGEGV